MEALPRPNEPRLLERTALLEELTRLGARARSGRGCVVLVAGEAGVGKSTLVDAFLRSSDGVTVARGGCDALFTPRPLGPLFDIARELRGELLRSLIAEAPRQIIFGALLDALEHQPVVLLVEDVHWADEATLDLLKYLGRRIEVTQALLVVTYRDDMIGPRHPLRAVLGELPGAATRRLQVKPLSRTAVAELAAATGHDPVRLYERTGGNPFYVTELLAAPDSMPASVRDAVLARAQALSAAAQEALEAASIVPGRIATWLLTELLDGRTTPIDECVANGMLRSQDDGYAFRHELAREAIDSSLSAERRRGLNQRAVEVLVARSRGSLAQIAHHAEAAGLADAVLKHAPEAAREAAVLGAHHQAVAHYRSALRYADGPAAARRPGLLEACSYECYLTGDLAAAIGYRRSLLEIAREADDLTLEGNSLRWLSRFAWFCGDRAEAEGCADRAIGVLERSSRRDEALAWAYSNRAQLYMLAGMIDGAVTFGNQALEIAAELGADEIRCHALNNIGTVVYSRRRDPAGYAMLEQSLEIALAHDYEEHAARAYTNLSSTTCWHREYHLSRAMLDTGIAYCRERDLDTWRDYMLGWRAKLNFDRGDWACARADAEPIVRNQDSAAMLRLPALVTLTRLAVRSGDPEATHQVAAARALAAPTGESQRVLPIAAAAAELAWYDDEPAGIEAAVVAALPVARSDSAPWESGELLFWLRVAGRTQPDDLDLAGPWSAALAGEWASAAAAFEKLGCPFEQALVLMQGDGDAKRRALELFEQSGAVRAAARLRRELRAAGERHLPRGPRATTANHPAGLTRRQAEVLSLLATGMTDGEIATKLHLSTKTVGHHVSAILTKLDVTSRREAAARARYAGLVGD